MNTPAKEKKIVKVIISKRKFKGRNWVNLLSVPTGITCQQFSRMLGNFGWKRDSLNSEEKLVEVKNKCSAQKLISGFFVPDD